MGFWGDFQGRSKIFGGNPLGMERPPIYAFSGIFGPDLTCVRVVVFSMGIAICHRRNFGQVWRVPSSHSCRSTQTVRPPHVYIDVWFTGVFLIEPVVLECSSPAAPWSSHLHQHLQTILENSSFQHTDWQCVIVVLYIYWFSSAPSPHALSWQFLFS